MSKKELQKFYNWIEENQHTPIFMNVTLGQFATDITMTEGYRMKDNNTLDDIIIIDNATNNTYQILLFDYDTNLNEWNIVDFEFITNKEEMDLDCFDLELNVPNGTIRFRLI